MSHYVGYIFTDFDVQSDSDIMDILEPYYEGLEVGERVYKDKEKLKIEFIEKVGANEALIKVGYEGSKELIKIAKISDEIERLRAWYGESSIDDEGNYITTYNPESKWDWFV